MRIAMVSEHASPLAVLGGVDAGGQNVHVAELATAVAARGHDVTVFTRRDDPALPERVPLAPGVVVEHLDAGPPTVLPKDDLVQYVPQMCAELVDRLSYDPPAVLHAHFWMSGLASLAAARELGVPMVQTFHALGAVKRRHQGAADTSPASRIGGERDLARHATRVLASCTDERAEVMRLGARPARIDVVPSGVDLDLFTPDGDVAPRGGRHRLLCVGRLVPRKGVDDAIRLVAKLPQAELVIAGGPSADRLDADEEVRRLRVLADQVGAGDRVQLVGSVGRDRLPALIRSADAVLCLPWYEPFGIVPLEAMACGVPVVASAVGGLLDTVVHGVTGVHVRPRDPAAAVNAVRALLADSAMRDRLGRAGRERARRYTWAEVAAAVESSYHRAGLTIAARTPEEVAG
ncbi:MAG: glycosyltransferase [Jatrophihabitans sp.]|uniref:glycosyltransferase n=1 Tax=Jatrophihabitans sp. TaxID=1932789 RepID=UPI003F7FA360